jgi:site-specific DNA-cytosine methylase
MNVLELFSGTGSVGKVCKRLDWNVVSVDMLLPADHQVDIMKFDYKQYPKDYFDIVWASPPCTNYSALKKCWYGRKLANGIVYTPKQNELDQQEADKLVLKSFEIIKYFNPTLWFVENPQTATLKNRDIMKDIPFYDVDYCMYSDWGYRKRTRIWTNKQNWQNLLCDKSGKCGNMINKKHKAQVNEDFGGGSNRLDRYRIPEDLIFSLFLE